MMRDVVRKPRLGRGPVVVMLALWCLAGAVWGQDDPSSSEELLWTGYTNTLLRLREGPSTEYPRLATLRQDRVVQVYREQDGWLYVQAGERLGWVSGEYVRRDQTERQITVEVPSSTVPETMMDDWSVERDGLLGRIRDLEVTRQSLEAQLEQPVAETNSEMQAELEELRGSYADAAELRIDLERANAERERLAAEFAAAQEQIARLTESLAAAESNSLDLERRTAELEAMVAAADPSDGSDGEAMDRELEELRAQLARTETEGDRLAEELNGARAELVELSGEMEELADRTRVAELQAADAVAALSESPQSDARASELMAQVDEQASQIEDLGARLAGVESERSELVISLAAAEDRATGLESEISGLRAVAASASEASASEVALRADLDAATVRVTSLEAALDTARLELAASQAAANTTTVSADAEKIAALEALEASLRRDLAASEQTRVSIWARLESMGRENAALKQQLSSRSQRAPQVAAEANPLAAPRPPYQEPLTESQPAPTRVAAAVPKVAPVAPLPTPAPELVTADEPLRATEVSEGVVLAVNGWAGAWSSQDVDRYLGFYAGSFLPSSGADRNAWEDLRRERIMRPSSIEVVVQGITTQFVAEDRAITTFVQEYRSDSYSDTVSKTIEWVRDGDDWKIESEAAVPVG